MCPIVYVDLRYLQDYPHRIRGIGQHLTALLRTRAQSAFGKWKTVGLIDPRSPKLPQACTSLVDEISGSLNPGCDGSPAVFIDGTPMTHDTRFGVRFLADPRFRTAAVVYDFIPLDWPGYLPSVHSRLDYFARMARLRTFDHFMPISEYTASRTSQLLGISRRHIHVTGASVRQSLYELKAHLGSVPSVYSNSGRYFFMVVGPDERKNPKVAVEAVRRLNLLSSNPISLKIAGNWLTRDEEVLLQAAGHPQGKGFLEFFPDVPDQQLAELFSGAIATIVPSHIEGFSLPVVEASVCGCPAIASDCAAHLELIEQSEALFPSDDAAILTDKLGALLNNPGLRASLVSSQAQLSTKFHENAVGRRFWDAMETAVQDNPVRLRAGRKKPKLALLSPFQSDHPDTALYTAMTMQNGDSLFHSDLYTDSPRPLSFQGRSRDARRVSVAPLLTGRYDRIVSVIGNSTSYMSVLDFFEDYGGPCILHDARLTQIYHQRLGSDQFLKFANKILRRLVSPEEVNAWLRDEQPSSLFLERVVERASPLIVHTPTQLALIQQHYGVKAHLATCCPGLSFKAADLTVSSRKAVRERLGIPASVFAVSSFGSPARSGGMDTCILAIELLRSWNIPAELYFVDNAAFETGEMKHIAKLYEVPEFVHSGTELQNPEAYRDFLIASDGAIQVRNYAFGAPSTPLSNCVSAGLPCVASSDMAMSLGAPSYALTVPDYFSHLHVAEQLALIHEAGADRITHEGARTAYLETHNFDYYTKRLAEILEIA